MHHLKVADLMTTDVVCVGPDCGLDALAALLVRRCVGGVPVVDETGRLLGVVSKTDLVRARGEEAPDACAAAFDPGVVARPPPSVVRDIMTPLAFTLQEDAPLRTAAALLVYEGVHRAPVVSRGGRLVGILSTLDLARAVAEAS